MAEIGENRAEGPEKCQKKLRILLSTYGWPMDAPPDLLSQIYAGEYPRIVLE
jgi:hypothetical protein